MSIILLIQLDVMRPTILFNLLAACHLSAVSAFPLFSLSDITSIVAKGHDAASTPTLTSRAATTSSNGTHQHHNHTYCVGTDADSKVNSTSLLAIVLAETATNGTAHEHDHCQHHNGTNAAHSTKFNGTAGFEHEAANATDHQHRHACNGTRSDAADGTRPSNTTVTQAHLAAADGGNEAAEVQANATTHHHHKCNDTSNESGAAGVATFAPTTARTAVP